ncbi:MAG: hypothetical protein Q4G43_13650 [Mobilicoccus sp.]|nr:hypothetical protein [Mobilicoccus sp.]
MTRRSAASLRPRPRALRAAALTPLVAVVLAGCQWTSPIQTDKAYEPADGRSTQLGNLAVNNLLVVADEKDGPGNLVGLNINQTNQDVEVSYQVAGTQQPITVSVPRHGIKQLSDPQGDMTALDTVPVAPGDLIEVTITTAGAAAETLRVPVVAPYPPYGDLHEGGPREFDPTPLHHPDGGH